MAETNGANNPDRLDRVEGIIEALADRQHLIEDEFARLLRTQVVMGDSLNQLTAEVNRIAEAQLHTDERLNALIQVVDQIVRDRRP